MVIQTPDGYELEDVEVPVSFKLSEYGEYTARLAKTVVTRRDGPRWNDEDRVYPVTLHSDALTETTRIKLPAGFAIDEQPPDIKLEEDFGKYEASWRAEGDELIFERRLLLHNAEVPPEQYEGLRAFFNAVTAAEVSPVVLAKQ